MVVVVVLTVGGADGLLLLVLLFRRMMIFYYEHHCTPLRPPCGFHWLVILFLNLSYARSSQKRVLMGSGESPVEHEQEAPGVASHETLP